MDLKQLEYFVAVAEELNFTRAAARVYATQSTVSSGIRSLESELRATLFERSSRQVSLSPAGAAFLPEARAALAALRRARDSAQEAAAGLRGSLRIGALTRIAVLDLPGLFRAFRNRYPLVDLHVTASPTGSTGLADDLRQGRLDVAVLGLPPAELTGLRVRELASRPYVAVLPAAHPLAGATALDPRDLLAEPFIDTLPGFGNRVEVDRHFQALGTPRRVAVEVADLTTVPDYVAADLGVAVVPDVALPRSPAVAVVPLVDGPPDWSFSVATADPTRAAAAFMDLVTDHRV
ncbi:LysR family transcriptional regulator [Actinokineospora bangkokensis]|uniref:LysR family transcriptional regulator n=1 Tax=Actinokineospora bangkokensis TaxID=1193682 RepID=A0A1Q9LKD6_9PSEU|nr:LysR family transcriptional regulator [Actinokineospora bangkokensis]OLR92463.1 LysR family transcriptional regulator [Actinokineospora bangkokensis]